MAGPSGSNPGRSKPGRSKPGRSKPLSIRTKLLLSLLFGVLCATAVSAFLVHSLGGLSSFHSPAPLTPQQQLGLALYSANCAACHEQNQLDLIKPPPSLHGVFSQPHLPSGDPATDSAVTRVILQGKNTMPAFDRRLTDPEVAAIVAYLHAGIR